MIAVSVIRLACALWLLAALPAAAAGTVLVFGDSLSAAYGISRDAGWVNLLSARLAREHPGWRVVNASISGETTAGGLARLPAALAQYQPRVVILALGANDGLRGLSTAAMERNLGAMVKQARERDARVLLAGMRVPPNYGTAYSRDFAAAFGAVAKRYQVEYLPFLLDRVASRRDLFLDDQLHPTAEAQPIILENVWPLLAPLLR